MLTVSLLNLSGIIVPIVSPPSLSRVTVYDDLNFNWCITTSHYST